MLEPLSLCVPVLFILWSVLPFTCYFYIIDTKVNLEEAGHQIPVSFAISEIQLETIINKVPSIQLMVLTLIGSGFFRIVVRN